MFDFSATEFLAIALVALIVIGPRELPGLLRQIGQMVGKVRRMAGEFQEQLNDAVDSSEIQDLKDEVGKLADDARMELDYDPAAVAEREMNEAFEGSKPAVQNPDYGDDPDDALVDFSATDTKSPDTKSSDTKTAPKDASDATGKTGAADSSKSGSTKDNAIVREPSTPRAAAPAKRLPVNAGNTTTADSVAAKPDNTGGKPSSSEG